MCVCVYNEMQSTDSRCGSRREGGGRYSSQPPVMSKGVKRKATTDAAADDAAATTATNKSLKATLVPAYEAIIRTVVGCNTSIVGLIVAYFTELEQLAVRRLGVRLASGVVLSHGSPGVRLRLARDADSIWCSCRGKVADVICDECTLREPPTIEVTKEFGIGDDWNMHGQGTRDVYGTNVRVPMLRLYMQPRYRRGEHGKWRSEDAVSRNDDLSGTSRLVDLDTRDVVGPELRLGCGGHNTPDKPFSRCEHVVRLIVCVREYGEGSSWLTERRSAQCLECDTDRRSIAAKSVTSNSAPWQTMEWFRDWFGLGRVVDTLRGPHWLAVDPM